ncbi:MAG: DNA polymerase III subunit delta' [Candidatus Auribacterota bacterium]|nr:DNA polymerase III subunit delta' [Candidatus Auribacterota bacterium]
MLWDKIQGQDGAVNYLRQSIARDRVINAYLFQGPSGVGKSLTASVFARALNCPVEPGRGCGSCPSCRQVEAGTHPDVHVVSPRSKSRMILIDQIHELQRMVSLSGQRGNWKVFIIQDADRMNINAQNAFLKTLEEPPDKTILILITHQADLLLTTIRSRCNKVLFSPWPYELMKQFLMAKVSVSDDESNVLYSISRGCPGRALQLLQEDLLGKRKRLLGPLLADEISSAEGVTAQVKTWLDSISSRSKELSSELAKERAQWNEVLKPAQRKKMEARDEARVVAGEQAELEMIFELIFNWFRDLFIYRETGEDNYIINQDLTDEIAAASRSRSPVQLRHMMEWVEKSRQMAQKTSNRSTRQLIFENMLIQLGY